MKKTANKDLGRPSAETFKTAQKLPVVVVLDNVRSMHNVGSTFRTSDAYLVEKIYLTGITATPPHREIHKTALGATETVDWVYEKEALTIVNKLKLEGYQIISVEQARPHQSLENFSPLPNSSYCLVFGNEVFGVSDEIIEASDFCLEIPQHGTKHSLNISVSVGVVLWKVFEALKLVEKE